MQQKRIKYIEFLYIASPLLLLIIATVSTVLQFINIATIHQDALQPFTEIAQNIKKVNSQRPISDLKLVPDNQLCTGGYTQTSFGKWAGTKSGCYSPKNGTLLDKTCVSSKVKPAEMDDWLDIPHHSEVSLQNWAGYKLCVKFVYSFQEVNVTTSGVKCPDGWKICSKGLICIPQNSEYPLTAVSVKFYGSWQAPNLRLERDPSQNAIVALETSINENPCVNTVKHPSLHNTSHYPLDIAKVTGCDKFGFDAEFTHKIHEESLLELYFQNKMSDVMKTLPDYKEHIKQESVGLYYRTRVNIEPSLFCTQTSHLLEIIINNIKDFNFGEELSIVLVAYNIIFIVFGFVMFFYLYCDRDNEQRDRYYREQKCLFHSFHFLPYIICILYIAQYVNIPADGGAKASNLVKTSYLLTSNRCFQGTQYYDIFSSLSNEVKTMTKAFFDPIRVMGIISYSFIGLMLLLRGVRGYYNNEVQAYEKDYLDRRFAATRNAETELVRAEGASPMDIVVYDDGDYEEGYGVHSDSPYFPYRDEDDDPRN